MLIAHLFYNYVKNSVIDLNNVDIIYLFNHSNVSASYYVFLKRESWKKQAYKNNEKMCLWEKWIRGYLKIYNNVGILVKSKINSIDVSNPETIGIYNQYSEW